MDQSGWGQPTPPPPPAAPSGWATPPEPPRRSKAVPILGALVGVVVILAVGLLVVSMLNANPDAGKVVFSTEPPTTGHNCQVSSQVTTIQAGKPVYASYIFSHKLGSEPALLSASKNGQAWAGPITLPNSSGLNCFLDTSDLSNVPGLPLDPGVYKFMVAVNGETVAEGTLTVTP
jgi:hypothetical protein